MSNSSNWQDFLDSHAELDKAPLISQGAMLIDLSHYGLIQVHGEDAESFLQNQLSNDIHNVTEETFQESAWCSPKGRIKANFRIFKQDDRYYLSVSADLIEQTIQKLSMYVMMSKVTIEDVSDSFVHFALAGDSSAALLKEILTEDSKQVTRHKSLSILNIAGDTPRFEVFGKVDDAKALWEQCSENATIVSKNAWQFLDIKAGIPMITAASSEAWIPQMVNYIAVGGVDFKKGCYPGQEVVARLNYLGKTKRQMYRIQIDTDQLPTIGDDLVSDTSAGKILNAAINSDGKVEALAVLKIAEAEKALKLSANDQAEISLLDLPYSLDNSLDNSHS